MELVKSCCKCKYISTVAVVGAESKEEPHNCLQILPEVQEPVGNPQHLPLGYSKVKYSSVS